MIPKEICDKYGIGTIEEYRENMLEGETEAFYYKQFLKSTDHIPLKLIEGSVTSAEVAEELKYREIARREIATINGESYEPKEEQKTLDERTEAAESSIDYLSMMTGVDIPTEV